MIVSVTIPEHCAESERQRPGTPRPSCCQTGGHGGPLELPQQTQCEAPHLLIPLLPCHCSSLWGQKRGFSTNQSRLINLHPSLQ